MEQILKELNDVLGTAKIRVQKCEEERAQNAALKSSLVGRENKVKAREEAVTKREKNVTVYEDLGAVQKENDTNLQINKDAANRLKEKEARLEEDYKVKADALAGDRALLEQQKHKLRKQAEELAVEKNTYRQKILDEIDRKMGGK